jgi:hypothetical protein
MPIHDWTRVSAGTFHDFHQGWTIALRAALNAGILPDGYYAMAEQKVRGPEPDVVTLQVPAGSDASPSGGVELAPPQSRQIVRLNGDRAAYARRANRIVVKNRPGRVVAVIEIVSPGNKDGTGAFNEFADKVTGFLAQGVHVLLVDLFPPTARDPEGIDRAVWDRLGGEPFEPRPEGKPLSVVAFEAGDTLTAYADPVAVGDPLPNAPLYLTQGWYVGAPLESSYGAAWAQLPRVIREEVEPPMT